MVTSRRRARWRLAAITALAVLATGAPWSSRATPGPGDPPGAFAYRRSTDRGQSFTAAQLDDVDLDLSSAHVQVRDGVVHAVFDDNTEGGPGGANDRSVYYRRSADGGDTFDGSVRLDNTAGDSSESQVEAVDDRVSVVWEDDRLLAGGDPDPAAGEIPPEGNSRFDNRDDIFFTRSSDQGRHFDELVNLSCPAEPRRAGETSTEDPTPPAQRCDSDDVHDRDPRVAMSPDGRTVAVVYEATDLVDGPESGGDFTKDDDVFLSVSSDGGDTWAVRNHNVSAAPESQLGPAVDVSESTIHLAWQNEADPDAKNTNRPLQYARSLDGGATFEPVRGLPGPHAQSAAVRAQGDVVHIVACEQDVPGKRDDTSFGLLYWRSTDGGDSFDGPAVLARYPEGCADPDIDAAGPDVHIAYEAEGDPLDSDVYYVRSGDGGRHWETAVNLANNAMAPSTFPSVSVDPARPDHVHLGWNDDAMFLLSVSAGQDLPGGDGRPVRVEDEDVAEYRGGTYRLVLDGSDVGLDALAVDALARLSADEFILSFTEPAPIGALGLVDDADLVLFTANHLGGETSGRFELYLDGSDIGLSDEDVDAVEVVTADGATDVYLSTDGDFALDGGLSGVGADVFVCMRATTGENTGCRELGLAFDGRAAELSEPEEGVDAFSFDGVGLQAGEDAFAYFSLGGAFRVPGASGEGTDVVRCEFENLKDVRPDRALAGCGRSVPLLGVVGGRANGLRGNLSAVELQY